MIAAFPMTQKDFNLLWHTQCDWKSFFNSGRFTCKSQLGDRFEMIDDGDGGEDIENVSDEFQVASWLGDNPASLILAQVFLRTKGSRHQVLWDMVEPVSFVILHDHIM